MITFLALDQQTINFKVIGLTRPGLEPAIYHTQGDHANNYTTDELLTIIVETLPDRYIRSECDEKKGGSKTTTTPKIKLVGANVIY